MFKNLHFLEKFKKRKEIYKEPNEKIEVILKVITLSNIIISSIRLIITTINKNKGCI